MTDASAEYSFALALATGIKAMKARNVAMEEVTNFNRERLFEDSYIYRLDGLAFQAKTCAMEHLAEKIPTMRREYAESIGKAKREFVEYKKQRIFGVDLNVIPTSRSEGHHIEALMTMWKWLEWTKDPDKYIGLLFCLGMSNMACLTQFTRSAARSGITFNRICKLLAGEEEKEIEVLELDSDSD